MSSELYALVALAARYWFVALIVIILFRGWRMTVADNRRAKLLRAWMGQTGCVGEWIANPGSKKRVSYPIPREGVLGSGRSADVRIRHRDVRRAHAHFELREGGLLVRPLGRAQLSVGSGHTGEAVFMQDGDVLTIGRLQLMLVLFEAPAEEDEPDEWFEVDPDDSLDDDEDYYDEPPVSPYARPVSAEGHGQDARREKRAVRVGDAILPGDAPVTARGRKSGEPRTAHRSRRVPDDAEIFFDPDAAPTGRKARGGRRAKAAPNKDAFDEDTIWPDL